MTTPGSVQPLLVALRSLHEQALRVSAAEAAGALKIAFHQVRLEAKLLGAHRPPRLRSAALAEPESPLERRQVIDAILMELSGVAAEAKAADSACLPLLVEAQRALLQVRQKNAA